MNLMRDLALRIPAIQRLYGERNALLAKHGALLSAPDALPTGEDTGPATAPFVVKQDLRSLHEFRSFESAQRDVDPIANLVFSDVAENTIIQHALTQGIRTDFHGLIEAAEVHVAGNEMREHLMARGFNSRQRAMLDMTLHYLWEKSIPESDARIYGHEAIGQMALALRGRFPRFIGTEYARNDQEKQKLFPIRHGDICRSDWPDAAFDLVLSGDVLEHVPSIDAALSETARILRPGGRLIATFPFLFLQEDSARFAEMREGKLIHYGEPIYHGNPMDPAGGSLVFEIPGWNIIQRATQAGFSNPRMIFWADQNRGIVGSNIGYAVRPRGVFVAAFDK